jgi:hypothetical protein
MIRTAFVSRRRPMNTREATPNRNVSSPAATSSQPTIVIACGLCLTAVFLLGYQKLV